MPVPGWYPDPAGTPGSYRYWDGHTWSDATTTDPATTPPPATTPATTSTGRSRKGPIIAIVAIIAVVAIITAIALTRGGLNRHGDVPEDTNTAAPTEPVWDETSTPTPEDTSNQSSQRCPVTTGGTTTDQVDGSLTGGNLRVPTIEGWDKSYKGLDWVADFHAIDDQIYVGWVADIAVGALLFEDGFIDLNTSARQTLECYASSGYYDGYTGQKDLVDEETTVDGHQAWHIQSEVYVSMSSLPQVRGDVVDIYVVDVGSNDHLGVFISSINLGDADRMAKAQECMDQMKVVP